MRLLKQVPWQKEGKKKKGCPNGLYNERGTINEFSNTSTFGRTMKKLGVSWIRLKLIWCLARIMKWVRKSTILSLNTKILLFIIYSL